MSGEWQLPPVESFADQARSQVLRPGPARGTFDKSVRAFARATSTLSTYDRESYFEKYGREDSGDVLNSGRAAFSWQDRMGSGPTPPPTLKQAVEAVRRWDNGDATPSDLAIIQHPAVVISQPAIRGAKRRIRILPMSAF